MALRIISSTSKAAAHQSNDETVLSGSHKITKIARQVKRPDRYSISIDGKYSFSLNEYQLSEAKLRLGMELSQDDIENFANESQFGKAYERSLRYVMIRPRSEKEIYDYLTRTFLYPKPKSFIDTSGQRHYKKQEVDKTKVESMIARVLQRLQEKGYINDIYFTEAWVRSRLVTKKSSLRKIQIELRTKGIDEGIIATILQKNTGSDEKNLQAVIEKKQRQLRYQDTKKLTQYLLRQGFSYDDIAKQLSENN